MNHQLNMSPGARWVLFVYALFILPTDNQAGAKETSPAFSRAAFTYKTVDRLRIQADVYRDADAVKWPTS